MENTVCKEERIDTLTQMFFDADVDLGSITEILESQNMILCNLFEEIGNGELYFKILTAQQLTESAIEKLKSARNGMESKWQKSRTAE